MSRRPESSGNILLVALAIAGLVSCNSPPKPEVAETKMAAILPLSGDFGAIGQPKKDAIELALEQIKILHPTLRLSVDFQDSRGLPAEGVSALRRSIDVLKVGVAYVDLTTVAAAAIPVVQGSEVILFAGSAQAGITDMAPNVFRVFPGGDQEVALLLDYVKRDSIRSLFILHTDEFYGRSVRDKLRTLATVAGVKVLGAETYSNSDNDFRTQLTKARVSKAERIVILGYGIKYDQILKQGAELRIRPSRFLANLGAANIAVSALPPALTDGLVFAGPLYSLRMSSLDSFPHQKDLVDRYVARFGHEPDFRVAFVYDNLILLAEVLAETRSVREARERLMNYGKYAGASGTIEFMGSRDAHVEMALMTYLHGKVVLVH